MSAQYFIETAGGLGDLIQSYFLLPAFRLLPILKKLEPEAYIRVIDRNVNSSADDFFRYHPHVNQAIHLPFSLPPAPDVEDLHREGCSPIQEAITRHGLDPGGYPDPHLYLTSKEQARVDSLRADGPYVAMHPFTWDDSRSMTQFLTIIDVCKLITQAGYRVVILGGSCLKNDEGGRLYRYQVDLEGPSIVNLVNQVPVRVAVTLAMQATKYVGSHSCFAMAAVAGRIPTLCYAYSSRRNDIAKQPPNGLIRRMEIFYSDCGLDVEEYTRQFLQRQA